MAVGQTASAPAAGSAAATGAVVSVATATGPAPPTIKFDVVVLKRCAPDDVAGYNTIGTGDSMERHCQTIKTLLNMAYGGGSTFLVKGEPDWVDTDPYDFVAKVAPEDAATWQKMDLPTKRLMVRAILPDILNLKVHTEIQSRPIYNLVVAKGGPTFSETKPDLNSPTDAKTPVSGSVHRVDYDEAAYTNSTMLDLAGGLAARLDRDVIDKTGLTGRYDFHVKPLPLAHYDPKTTNVEDTDFGGIINGVESLGLKLEPGKSDTNVIVIDHIERPQEN
jgi:uncharacterized protein (TIGR03435 family)